MPLWPAAHHALEEVTSTNDAAAELARQGAATGTVVTARRQTRGRGRRDRVWQSPEGGLWMSVIFRDVDPRTFGFFTLAAALGIRDALARFTGECLELCWPNDIFRGHDKLAGMLAEVIQIPDGAPCAVLGLGVNVNNDMAAVRREIQNQGAAPYGVTSLAELTDKAPALDKVLAAIIDGIEKEYRTFMTGKREDQRRRILAATGSVGKPVTIETPQGVLQGIFADLQPDGALLLDQNGKSRAVYAGDVVHVRDGGPAGGDATMAAALDGWKTKIWRTATAKNPERRQRFGTYSGIELQPTYAPEPADSKAYLDAIGFPGGFPYTRGIQPTMYRGRFWTMRQYSGFSTARESNARYKYLLAQGQTGLSVAFDLPTQIGYDPDHELCLGEVGKVGVSIASLRDMEILLDGIPLDTVSTSMTINATAPILLALYIAVGKKQGVPAAALTGTVQNDILKEYATRGTYRFNVRPSLRLVTDLIAYCHRLVPKWNTISISGYHIREAGCTAAQEIAFTLANGIAYVDLARQAGLDVDDFAPRLSFFFNAHNNLFEEVAKFRAARRMWARLMRDRFGAKKEASLLLRFHTQTAGVTLTSQQYDNNIARVTLQALAAVLGGTQSLHTNSRDEALALPTETSARIALRTQQIIAHESGAADVIDPLGGSPYIETLTDELERRALDYIGRIDRMGGAVAAIEAGFIQKEIQQSAYAYQRAVESGEQIIVGVNAFQTEEAAPADILRVDNRLRDERLRELDELKRDRDNEAVRNALAALRAAAAGNANLLPPILAAVECYATIGEICAELAAVFGEYRTPFL